MHPGNKICGNLIRKGILVVVVVVVVFSVESVKRKKERKRAVHKKGDRTVTVSSSEKKRI